MPHTSQKAPPSIQPIVIPRQEHNISRKAIDSDALKVLRRLVRHGHESYLVGGGVRDLLMGRVPQDFDISTSAHPNEIKKLFSNCRLIGKRFRLAHIYFKGRKIIEVSTFRKISEQCGSQEPIRSDNTFGTPCEDAFRRDFTVNALFYSVVDFSVIDNVGGIKDLQSNVVRTIGDPYVRFCEDPIRILRAVRFAALLDFSLNEEDELAITQLKDRIWQGAVPRILEEILRMMSRGTSQRAFTLLHQLGLLETLLPKISRHVRANNIQQNLDILTRLDTHFRNGAELSPALTLSCLFYPAVSSLLGGTQSPDKTGQVKEVLSPAIELLQIPRRVRDTMQQILANQHRYFDLRGKRFKPRTLIRKSYFKDGLTLFRIIAGGTSEGMDLVRDWEEISRARTPHPPLIQRKHRRKKRNKNDG